VLAVVALVLVAGCAFTPTLDPKPVDPSSSSRILADDGSLLARIDLGVERDPISLAHMTPSLPAAVIAVEDHRFYQHDGVDYRSIIRALSADVSAGAAVQGGSTITQQYVRNVLLTNEKTVHRKLREAVLAIELERHYSKQEILERYLNAVYFGNGAYGVEVAAERYFDTDAAHLRLEQSALLAALLRAPDDYDPYRHPASALARRNLVLDDMVRYHWATAAEVAGARKQPLEVVRHPTASKVIAPYFVERVRDWFLANPTFGKTEADRAALLNEGGLQITTTLDPHLQQLAEQSVATVLSDRAHDPAAALVAMDPSDGHVLAYVGGRGFDGPEAWARYDLAGQPPDADGISGRPGGSTFKPFVLAAALERHIPLSRTYDGPAALNLKLPDGKTWLVHNYDNEPFGKLDLVDATVNSVNTVYAQLMLAVGPQYATAMAQRLGITTSLQAVPSAVLGINDVRVIDMADAYATFANDGVRTNPVLVTKVVDAHGTVLYDARPVQQRVLAAPIARTVNQVLEQVVTRGTGVNARIGRPVAGKTGTGEDYKDAWFVGSVPQLTAAVWVGFADKPRSMVPPTTRVKVTGGSWPANIWAQFMGAATADMPIADFPSPPADASSDILPTAPLPAVVGMPVDQATALLKDAGYAVSTTTAPSTDYPPGTVVDQSPGPHVAVRAQTVVTLTVAADASQTTTVPLLLGLTTAQARATATAAGITLDVVVAPEPPPVVAGHQGKIWKQSIPSGTSATRGTTTMTVWANP
jgi:penicillin-binding protein 1A